MKFGVVVFPGSNCDRDCYHAIGEATGEEVEYIWHDAVDLDGFDCIVLPGGFSYGDYLRAGAVARFSRVMDRVRRAAENGKLIIGICNGFQILLEAGLLPGAMLRNNTLKFRCKTVSLRVETRNTPFTNLCEGGQVVRMPIAHGEGNFYIDEAGLRDLESKGLVVFRYCDDRGRVTPEVNPNGSIGNIAGICNERRNILGMMPHPERCAESILGSGDGRLVFQSIRRHLAEGALVSVG